MSNIIHQGKARYPVREAVIHCSATLPDWMSNQRPSEQWAEIRRWHKARKWRDIGYHRGIARDGTLLLGRSLWSIGAGVKGHNRGVIHICLLGGHGSSADDRFEEHFTTEQERTLRLYLKALNRLTPIDKLTGHNDYANKACPGFAVKREDWM